MRHEAEGLSFVKVDVLFLFGGFVCADDFPGTGGDGGLCEEPFVEGVADGSAELFDGDGSGSGRGWLALGVGHGVSPLGDALWCELVKGEVAEGGFDPVGVGELVVGFC